MNRVLALLVVLLAAVAAIFYFLRPHAPATGGADLLPRPATTAAPPAMDLANARVVTPRPRPRDGGARAASTIVKAAWGSGLGQLGRRAAPESVSEGPMSFFVDKSGVIVVDNVNARLARFDAHGKPLPPIALPNEAAQDVTRGPRDSIAVLDRLRGKDLALYAADGKQLAAAPLAGAGIDEPGGVTGVFADRSGDVYAEVGHAAWLRLFDAAGKLDAARTRAPGRPTRDGHFVTAAIADRTSGTAHVQLLDGNGATVWSDLVSFEAPILYIALVDGDAAGDVVIAAHTGHEATTPPYRITDETLAIIALSPSGDELGRLTVAAPPPAEEAFRDLWLGDDGTVYWMRRSPSGVQIDAYRLL